MESPVLRSAFRDVKHCVGSFMLAYLPAGKSSDFALQQYGKIPFYSPRSSTHDIALAAPKATKPTPGILIDHHASLVFAANKWWPPKPARF